MDFLFAIFCGALGAVLASFAGVVSERLNTGESWTTERSRCNACDRTLTVLDLIPILSWAGSGGRCRTCKAIVPYRYALTEGVTAILFFLFALTLGPGLALVVTFAFLFLLLVVVLYDLRHQIVPLGLSLALILLGAGYAWVTLSDLRTFSIALLTAGLIASGFFLLHIVSGGRWMGLGDAPIALALSLFVAPYAVSGLLFSFWTGAVIGILILVSRPKGHRMGIEVPFVPFLALGYLLAYFVQWNPFQL